MIEKNTIISKTPVRFSLAAGGNDLDAYWKAGFIGATVSVTINKYIYVKVEPSPKWLFSKPDILIKAVVDHIKPKLPIKVSVRTDLPAGTGLGAGGAITVGLVNAISQSMNKNWPKAKIAKTAYEIERGDLGFSCGKKDQYSTSFGGLNLIKYYPNGATKVIPINLGKDLSILRKYILLFDTGKKRGSEKILKNQQKISQKKILKELHLLNDGALDIAKALIRRDFITVGKLMAMHWEIKRRIIPGISNRIIDKAYSSAIRAGAFGGRISGAGGGGYLIIYAPPSKRVRISKVIGLKPLPFKFEKEGTRIIN